MAYSEEERRVRALAASARYRERNREKERARAARYRAENPEKITAYAESHKEQNQAAVVAWAKANPERTRAIQRKYDAKPERRTRHKRFTPEQKAARVRSAIAWKKRNVERAAAAARRYKHANPDKIRVIKQNRRARIKGQHTKLSDNIIERLGTLQRWRCAGSGCACDLRVSGHELDHVVPLALDGNTDHNMQLLCPPCNREKNAKHPVDWAQSRGLLL